MSSGAIGAIGALAMFFIVQFVIYPQMGRTWRGLDKQALGRGVDTAIKIVFLGGLIVIAAYMFFHHQQSGCFNYRYDDC